MKRGQQSPHGHAHDAEPHEHAHDAGPRGWLAAIFHLHGHGHDEPDFGNDPAFATREGIRTVWIALAALGITTVIQAVIVVLSGSVALLADTVHNLGDFLNSVPLLIAFYLARRAATRRYTYGYGRAEDVAGVAIVLSIAFSAGYILWESARKLLDPQPLAQLPWVAVAALVGTVGNEAVAYFQIRTGRRIGSEALIADGLHARIDGLTSLVVLFAVAGSALGYPIVDPLVGLTIGVAILFIARDAARRIWYRLMDAVDPPVVDRIEQCAGDVPGVARVAHVRARWVGHQLYAEVGLVLDAAMSLEQGQRVIAAARHALRSDVKHLAVVTIEMVTDDPAPAPVATASTSATSTPVRGLLPPRYQDPTVAISVAPPGSTALR